MKCSTLLRVGTLGLAAFTTAICPAYAGEDDPTQAIRTLETIIITTQKTEETLLEVPIAVSAFDSNLLDKLNLESGAELQFAVPNFQASQGNFTDGSLGIRGILNAAVAPSSDPSIGAHFNGLPTNFTPLLETEFYDVERIEVLRGPQGTLYGRNATAGVINVISAKPVGEFTGYLKAGYGSYDMRKFEGAVNIPLSQSAGLRLAGYQMARDGYSTAILQPEGSAHNVDSRDITGLRASLGGELTNRFSAYLVWDYYEEDDTRLRATKQYCETDQRPFPFNQGCTPYQTAGLGYARDERGRPVELRPGLGVTNNAATFSGILAGATGLYDSVGVNGNAGAELPSDLRLFETNLLPVFSADQERLSLELSYAFENGLTLTLNTSKTERNRYSRDDYNKTVSTVPFNVTPLTPDTDGDGAGEWLGLSAFGLTSPIPSNIPPGLETIVVADLSIADYETLAHEIRLQSDFEGRFNFNVGAIQIEAEERSEYTAFFSTAEAYGVALGLPADRTYFRSNNPYSLDALGVFAEGYFDLSDALKFTLGLRYTDDQKTQPNTPPLLLTPAEVAPGELNGDYATGDARQVDFEEVTGRAGFDWRLDGVAGSDALMLYAFYSRGYKGGGLNTSGSQELDGSQTTFDPELIDSIEFGVKSAFGDNRLLFNATGFYYDYAGYQVSSMVDRNSININIDAELYGFEAEATARLTDAFTLNVGLGLLHSELDDGLYIDPYDQTGGDPNWLIAKNATTGQNCIVSRDATEALLATPFAAATALACSAGAVSGTVFQAIDDPSTTTDDAANAAFAASLEPAISEGVTVQVGGNELPRAPNTTLSVGAEYLWVLDEWTATLRADAYYQSEMYTRIFNLEADRIDSWSNVNASMTFIHDDSGFALEFYAKNLFDEDQVTNQYLTDASSGLFTNIFVMDPRRYGMTISKRW